jgi:hypothetical protein
VPWLATPQVAADMVARAYSITSFAPRNAIWHRDCSDLDFRGAFCDSGGVNGCGHLRPVGYALVGRVITSYLAEATERARNDNHRPNLRRGSSLREQTVQSSTLPPPIFDTLAKASAGADGRCARGADMRGLVRSVSGDWALVKRDPRQPPGPDKPGLLSLSAPSVLRLNVGATPAGAVAIGFLRSYDERMGVVDVGCDEGCTCLSQTLNGWHARKSSVLAFAMLATSVGETCILRLTHRSQARAGNRGPSVAARHSSNSSKFKILALVVPPFAIDGDRDMRTGSGFTS